MRNFTPVPLWRIVRDCSLRVQWKLAFNFAWRGRQAVLAFERRLKAQRAGRPDARFFPAFTLFSLTNRCDLSCRGCWVSPTRPPRELSLERMKNAINACRRRNSRFFGLLGGEPLLYEALFPLMASFPDCYFQVFTNGQQLTGEIARRMARLANVTPLVSIEGLTAESRRRRGGSPGDDIFGRAAEAVGRCREAGLFTGVAASICRSNYDELVSRSFIDLAAAKGAHYLWYYIYRPVGPKPEPENALSAEQIAGLRRFLVDERRAAPIFLIDAYWDHQGRALCPAAIGLSHHIAPDGALEFCPPLQFAGEWLDADGTNLEAAMADSEFLARLRAFTARRSRGCVLLEDPRALGEFLRAGGARDSSGRNATPEEWEARDSLPDHDMAGDALPEKNPLYAWAKKHYFFGFGAYG